MKKNDIQAFPLLLKGDMGFETGMTLRDYFAAAIITGMHTNREPVPCDTSFIFEHMARKAYEMADAMLKARDVD